MSEIEATTFKKVQSRMVTTHVETVVNLELK